MHTSEGMVMFGAAFVITGLVTWMISKGEDFYARRRA